MTIQTAKIINVIEVKTGEDILYFTLDGMRIGGFEQGVRLPPEIPQPPTPKPVGSVVKPISPKVAKAESEKEDERTFEQILKREKK